MLESGTHMSQWCITPQALNMAWRMVRTVLSRHSVSRKDRSRLLLLAAVVALEDLLGSGSIRWKKELPSGSVLLWSGNQVRLAQREGARLTLHKEFSPREAARAAHWAEEIFDRYGMDETERATLFTALPCLALWALSDYLEWNKKPPFPELE